MADIRLFTKSGCPHCVAAEEWRQLSGGVGVPVLAHGKDLVIGFIPERYGDFLTSCRQTTSVAQSEVDADVPASAPGSA